VTLTYVPGLVIRGGRYLAVKRLLIPNFCAYHAMEIGVQFTAPFVRRHRRFIGKVSIEP
jgi:hypothetical protein